MRKHTPSPWEARCENKEGIDFWEVVHPDDRDQGSEGPNRDLVCDLGLLPNRATDAYLIAAAPELFDACVKMEKVLSSYGVCISDLFGNDEEFLKAREIARTAIAKVEGTHDQN